MGADRFERIECFFNGIFVLVALPLVSTGIYWESFEIELKCRFCVGERHG